MPLLNATIISLSQDMDLQSGSMANFMMLRLPNGKVVRALIGDDAAQDIVSLSVVSNGATIPSPPPNGAEHTEDAVDVTTHVFGGTDRLPDVPVEQEEEPSEPAPATPPPRATPAPPPRQSRRPKSVSRDEMGYPVVQLEGGVDPRDLTGSRDQDEDGVGQI